MIWLESLLPFWICSNAIGPTSGVRCASTTTSTLETCVESSLNHSPYRRDERREFDQRKSNSKTEQGDDIAPRHNLTAMFLLLIMFNVR